MQESVELFHVTGPHGCLQARSSRRTPRSCGSSLIRPTLTREPPGGGGVAGGAAVWRGGARYQVDSAAGGSAGGRGIGRTTGRVYTWSAAERRVSARRFCMVDFLL